MKAAITGANGYIASKLTKALLKDGYSVSAIVHHSDDQITHLSREYPGRIELFRDNDLDAALEDVKEVYHLAGYYSTNESTEFERSRLIASNLLFTQSLWAAIERSAPDAFVVAASSFSQLNERGENAPQNLYSSLKAIAELSTPSLRDRSAFLRISDTFGPDDPRPKVHNLCAKSLLSTNLFEFKSPADTPLVLTHVLDVMGALRTLAQCREPGAYNLMNPELQITLGELGQNLKDEYGGEVRFPSGNSKAKLPVGVDLIPGWGPLRSPQNLAHELNLKEAR